MIAAGKSCDPREFLHSAVLRMIRYDEKNKTEYFKTLHAYLRNGRHLEDTAEALFIHKNTVSYRVNKIRELFGVDLDDADTELNLYFSCKLVELSEYQMI